jgi:hypothetical protein
LYRFTFISTSFPLAVLSPLSLHSPLSTPGLGILEKRAFEVFEERGELGGVTIPRPSKFFPSSLYPRLDPRTTENFAFGPTPDPRIISLADPHPRLDPRKSLATFGDFTRNEGYTESNDFSSVSNDFPG